MKRPIETVVGNTKVRFTYAPHTGRVTLKAPTESDIKFFLPFADMIHMKLKSFHPENTIRGQISVHRDEVVFQIRKHKKQAPLPEGMPTKLTFPENAGV